MSRKLRMALIGGAGNGFIGKVHATAATMDRQAELVAGVFSSSPERSLAAADQFSVDPDRAYANVDSMIESELRLSPERRIDFASIATPNHTHYELAKVLLESGFDVVCDKPMTTTIDDAESLRKTVESSGRMFVLTHNYSGYPMVRQAREMIASGELGEVHTVRVRYIQGWMWGLKPGDVPARGAWKSNPELAGPSGAMGDIGTHAYQLARFVTQLRPKSLRSHVRSVSGHQLDDYGVAAIETTTGAWFEITASQVSHGRLNDVQLEVDGTKGSLQWFQEHPNQLVLRRLGEPTQTFERNPNAAYSPQLVRDSCRIPAGHPEAFLEAFANVYRGFYHDLARRRAGENVSPQDAIYPTVDDGVEGVRFIYACLESHKSGQPIEFCL